MLDLYFWPTPNCYKVAILLEELELPYSVKPIHIGKGEQFTDAFIAISPNNKVPALADPNGPDGEPISLFESGAIMTYLADKAGSSLAGDTPRDRAEVNQWLMFQMGSLGPMLGQAHHFRRYAREKIPYAVDRYTDEATRLYRVMDRRLASTPFLAGAYSIADMATYPWIRPHKWQGQSLEDYPHLQRWYSEVRARPAVVRAVEVMRDRLDRNRDVPKGEAWDRLFGKGQLQGEGAKND
ncbi:glutathione S-transferase family protein [Pararhodobacter oceanensis]|uniref:glutathione S-transferase family protein n=1 Tax=Pararhodobacter oceanensis TaxID=2172121 RepID=UPI003A956487